MNFMEAVGAYIKVTIPEFTWMKWGKSQKIIL
jgi:hypothetical protein